MGESLMKILEGIERPSIVLLQNLEALIIPDPRVHNKAVGLKLARVLTEIVQGNAASMNKNLVSRSVLLAAVASDPTKIPRPVRRWFTNEIVVRTPDRTLREQFFASEAMFRAPGDAFMGEDDVKTMAAATAGQTVQSLNTTCDLYGTVHEDITRKATQGQTTTESVADTVISLIKPREKKKLGAPEIPKVRYACIENTQRK